MMCGVWTALAVVAAVVVVKRVVFRVMMHRRGFGHMGGFGHRFGHRGFLRGHHGGPRTWLRSLFVRLETTPSQEKVIVDAITELRETTARARSRAPEVRDDVSRAIRGEMLDESALGAAQAKVDAATSEIRLAMAEAIRRIHEVLDTKQRDVVADWISRGAGRGIFGGGPYRSVSI